MSLAYIHPFDLHQPLFNHLTSYPLAALGPPPHPSSTPFLSLRQGGKVLLCSSDWPRTHCVAQFVIELMTFLLQLPIMQEL